MRTFWIILQLFSLTLAKSQSYCATFGAFLSPSYPTSTDTIIVNIDTAITYYGQSFYTKLKIAKPIGDILPFAKRPLIIGIHGGGFISDSISLSATNGYLSMYNNMHSAAQFGYIGASLDYRTGYGKVDENIVLGALMAPGFPACNAVTTAIMDKFDDASYRATYDCLKSIDFICKHSSLFPYIDTTQIYLYGSSAGAIVALNAVLSELNEYISLPLAEQKPFPTRHKISGVIALAGAVNNATLNKLQSSTFNSYTTPLFLAHGNKDTLLSNNAAPLGNCTNIPSNYYKYGSSILSSIACNINIPHQLFLIDNAGHDLGATSPVANTLISSSFTFLYNSGICPSFPISIKKLYNLNGSIISQNFCPPLGLNDKEINKIDFVVFPSPAKNNIEINFEGIGLKKFSVKIFSMLGEKIIETNDATEINISVLPKGCYILNITSGEYSGQRKFFK
jgi:Secretion system C-terminal sorting domain